MNYKKISFLIFALAVIFTFSSCKINRVKNKERHGKWIEHNKVDEVNYQSIGRFKDGLEKGTHKQFANKKLYRKEKYKNGICETTYYHPNGKISSQGKTQLDLTEKQIHWYYQGDWKFFNEEGNLIGIKTYEKGELINLTEIKTE